MAQASSQWRQWVSSIQNLPSSALQLEDLSQLPIQQFRGVGGWLVSLVVVAMLLWLNWKLVIATALGVCVAVLVYFLSQGNWQPFWANLYRLFSGPRRQFAIAIASGIFTMLSAYIAASIWVESGSPWLATSTLLQGGSTLAVLALLAWQFVSQRASRSSQEIDRLLMDLVEPDSLKRLIAVQRITRLVSRNEFQQTYRVAEVADCFRVMLEREQQPELRNAVLHGLRTITKTKQLRPSSKPLVPAISSQKQANARLKPQTLESDR